LHIDTVIWSSCGQDDQIISISDHILSLCAKVVIALLDAGVNIDHAPRPGPNTVNGMVGITPLMVARCSLMGTKSVLKAPIDLWCQRLKVKCH
jgi:hypothetical protein